jgi:oxaloacetate decarboxylase
MARRTSERRRALRAILNGDRLEAPAALFDPISARIAAEVGFKVGFLSGALVSHSRLGSPDYALLTLDELAGQARQIGRATGLPILADGDHGYGGALNVRRTVEELEMAGVAGLVLEDTDLPARRPTAPTLIPTEAACGKLRAALAARTDESLVIIARTNLLLVSHEEAAARVAAYFATGVDGVFLSGLRSAEDLPQLTEARGPLVVYPAPGAHLDVVRLADGGARLLLRNVHDTFAASADAIRTVLIEQAQAGLTAPGLDRSQLSHLENVTGAADAREWLEAFQP